MGTRPRRPKPFMLEVVAEPIASGFHHGGQRPIASGVIADGDGDWHEFTVATRPVLTIVVFIDGQALSVDLAAVLRLVLP